jgi:hypothetical protein
MAEPVAAHRVPSRATPVWAALARRELRFTLRHPLLLAGLVASAWVLWSMNPDQVPHLGGFSTYVGLGLAPLAGGVLLVGHLAASRAQRHQTLEIESTAPAIQRARTLGRLVGTTAGAVLAAAALTVAYMAYLYLRGGAGTPDVGELLVGPVVAGLATAAGVAAGTWLPNRFIGLLALGVLAGVQIWLQDAPGTRHWFAWWHTVLWHPNPDLWIRPTWGHLGYLAGVLAAVGAVTMLRHGLRPVPVVLLAAGLVTTAAAGAVQARPPRDAAVDELFVHVEEPERFWVTIEQGSVTYRVHPGYERWVDKWDPVIQRTLAPIPVAQRPALVVEERHHPYLSQLEEEFGYGSAAADALGARSEALDWAIGLFGSGRLDRWPIRVNATTYLAELEPLAVSVAHRAAGLPLAPVSMEGRPFTDEEIAAITAPFVEEGLGDGGLQPAPPKATPGEAPGSSPQPGDRHQLTLACSADGQAREVVAAWLAARASDGLADSYRRIRAGGPGAADAGYGGDAVYEYAPDAGPAVRGVSWASLGWLRANPYGADTSTAAVLGSPTATDLAAQLLDRPQGEVAASIAENWNVWTDATTPIDAIVDEFDLEPAPTPEQWLARGGLDPAEFAESLAAYPLDLFEHDLLGDQPYPTCR